MGLKKTIKKIAAVALAPIALVKTGRHAAKKAANEANTFAAESAKERAALDAKTKKERLKAQKLAIRGLRSKRAASYFSAPEGGATTYGSTTIG